MKILVCVSKAPDTTAKINFTDGNSKFDENGVQFIINPYDEWYALVRGLELKETNGSGTVTTITVGGADNDPIIRKALAIGADDAVRIDTEATDALLVAQEIAAFAKDKNYDLILCGKETINYNGGLVSGMIAAYLDLPFVSQASKLDKTADKEYTLERDVDGGVEKITVSGSLVISCAKGMSEQRIPNMRGIMAARSKPLQVVSTSGVASLSNISTYDVPASKAACKLVDSENMDELIELLHSEAKVI